MLQKTLERGILVFVLFAFYTAVVLLSSPKVSPPFDEPNHLRSGMAQLSQGRYVDVEKAWWTLLDPMHPPSDIFPAALAWLNGRSAVCSQ